mmetsp:Transcript_22718/g.77291  ORF Transcript_22718/g.77291 Transcript_22718/m.77291 type:complete len:103 (-) Transcript_22718:938-1246(-)|eukprot:CAMPEP_0183790374 /NCGR_PEP_ID=MMETSP0803_2-20130417/1003_1 /TAXON_ID=195967 /ORGANISM="Crustomastix stigmata, Strain CCMP3273" /LENGTH=102 /DNA_ID=CAMNT_0026034589 /DNA_START=165 /DNA_END=473 /DNA_ORIENTATION=-
MFSLGGSKDARGGAPSKASKEDVARVKEWIRNTVTVQEGATVMVTELQCKQQDCPPFETIMVLIDKETGNQKRRLHKRICEITEIEVKAVWEAPELPPAQET